MLTTPDDPGGELMEGLALLEARHGLDPGDVADFVHGTTVGINTIIQRKGARLALVTNAGFEDVIELARLRMPEMYSLFCARPDALIPRDLVFGVGGRILADGSEADAARRRGAGGGRGRGAGPRARSASSISFLHAYRNPAHERAAKARLDAVAPDLFVLRVERGLAGDPRIRAHHDRHHERLRPPARGRLSLVAGAETWRARRAGPARC